MKFLKFAAIFLIFVLSLCGLMVVTDARAKNNAEKFCNSVVPGTSTKSLVKLAIDSGASVPKQPWRSTTNSRTILTASFTGIDPFYGHICRITASNELVASKELTVLDP